MEMNTRTGSASSRGFESPEPLAKTLAGPGNSMPTVVRCGLGLLAFALAGCGSVAPKDYSVYPVNAAATISAPAPSAIRPEWKERIAVSYVYIEHIGDYRQVGDSLRELFEAARNAGLEPNGAPFTLFYDDPGLVAFDRLRARACLPVDPGSVKAASGLAQDILPQAMVAYGHVSGAYDQVPQSYAALLGYLKSHSWSQNGPIREIYLVDPGAVESWDALVTEVQVPWTVR